jgi:hypothetical protein
VAGSAIGKRQEAQHKFGNVLGGGLLKALNSEPADYSPKVHWPVCRTPAALRESSESAGVAPKRLERKSVDQHLLACLLLRAVPWPYLTLKMAAETPARSMMD